MRVKFADSITYGETGYLIRLLELFSLPAALALIVAQYFGGLTDVRNKTSITFRDF